MSQTEKISIIALEPISESLQTLISQIGEREDIEIHRVSDSEAAIKKIAVALPCMLIGSIEKSEQIPGIVNLLKKVEKLNQSGQLKSLVCSKIKNQQLSKLISGLGITDYIEEPVPFRTLSFKANLQIKSIITFRKQQALKKAANEKLVIKSAEEDQSQENNNSAQLTTKQAPALQIEEDTFLFKNAQPKRIGKKLILEVDGPAPETGKWVQHEDKGDAENRWRWVPEENENNPEASKEDGWIYDGDKPQFNEKTGKWALASEKPSLVLNKKGEKVAEKVTTNEKGELAIAADSAKAEENLRKNKQSAQAIKQKKEALKTRARHAATEKNLKDSTWNDESNEEKAVTDEPESAERTPRNAKESPPKDLEPNKIAASATPTDAPSDPNLAEKKKSATEASSPEMRDKRSPENKKPTELKDKRQKSGEKSIGINDLTNSDEESEGATGSSASEDDTSAQKKPEKTGDRKIWAGLPKEEIEIEERKNKSKAPKPKAREKAEIEGSGDSDDTGDNEINTESKIDSGPAEKVAKAQAKILTDDTLLGETAPEKKRKSIDEESDLNNKQPRAKAPPLKPIEKKAKKEELLKKIEEVMSKPIPEKLPPQIEEQLRKDLNLENQPDIPAKEIAKRARLKAVKKLKESILELDLESDVGAESASKEKSIVASKDDPENTSSIKSIQNEKRKGSLRAFDSDISEAEKAERERKKGDATSASTKDREGTLDRAKYLPENELLPLGGAWESAEDYYVYLDGNIRYHGFESIETLLPLWIYKGEKVPELLGKTKLWKFLDTLPFSAKTVAEIPISVKDFLLGLKQEEEVKAIPAEKEATSTAPDPKRKAKEISAENPETKKTDKEISASAPERQSSDGIGSLDTKKSEKVRKAPTPTSMESHLAALKKVGAARNDESNENSERSKQREEKKRAGQADTLEEIFGEKKKFEPVDADPFDKLAQLKASLEEESKQLQEKEIPSDRAAAPLEDESPEAEASPATTNPEADNIQKFMERRKQKDRSVAPAKKAPPQNPYLAIYVCASDMLGSKIKAEKAIQNLLQAIEMNFGQCEASISDKPALANGISFPITKDSAEGRIRGHLCVKMVAARKKFSDSELEALKKCVGFFWTLQLRKEEEAQELKSA